MGGNEIYGGGYYDYRLSRALYGENNFWANMTGLYTNSLKSAQGNFWAARFANQMWNTSTHDLAHPYGFYFNFTGTPRYVVASSDELSYPTAIGMHYGLSSIIPSTESLLALRESTNLKFKLQHVPGKVAGKISNLAGIASWNDKAILDKSAPGLHDYLKEHNAEDLQKAKEIENQVKKLKAQLELVMENKTGLPADKVLEQVEKIGALVDELTKTAEPILKSLLKAQQDFIAEETAKAQEEIEEQAEEEVEGDDGDADSTKTQHEAKADFRKAYAEATDGTYDSSKVYKPFPEEITYSADKKEYKVTVEGKTFTGKDFAELDKKISKSTDENIKDKWAEIKEELLEETGKTRRPAKRREEYTPAPEQTSAEKTEVTKNGTKVKVKNKDGQQMAGKYYEYKGKIYKIEKDQAKPIDVTDSVEKVTT